jgi:hypothetical protein
MGGKPRQCLTSASTGWGCSPGCSPGCAWMARCYSATLAKRSSGTINCRVVVPKRTKP